MSPEIRLIPAPVPADMHRWLLDLRARSFVPASDYRVSAVLAMRTDRGMLCFGGVNIECTEPRLSLHGEECALAVMVTALGRRARIDEAWVMGAPGNLHGPGSHPAAQIPGKPCGNCRQQIHGLARSQSVPVHGVSLNGGEDVSTIGALLPGAFGYEFLAPVPDALPENEDAKEIPVLQDIRRSVFRSSCTDIFSWLRDLESIDESDHISQSVVLEMDDGSCAAGVRIDNAAYTGLSAVQSALGVAVSTCGTFRIGAVHVLTSVRQGGIITSPPSPAALQGIGEFSTKDLQVNIYGASGERTVMGIGDALRHMPRFGQPGFLVHDGALKGAG